MSSILKAAFCIGLAIELASGGAVVAEEGVPPPDEYVIAEYTGGKVTEAELITHLALMGLSPETLVRQDPLLDTLPLHIAKLAAREILQTWAYSKGMEQDADYLAELRDKKRDLRIQALKESLFNLDPVVSEQEAREYYDKHREHLDKEPKVWFQHIFLPAKASINAEELVSDLRSGKMDFAAAAVRYSTGAPRDELAQVLGPVSPGQLLPEVEPFAFSAEPGEISDPIATRFGIEIVRMTRRELGTPEFEKVEDGIRQRVLQERSDRYFDFVKTLRARVNVRLATGIENHLEDRDFILAHVDDVPIRIRDVLAYVPRRQWKRDPLVDEKDFQELIPMMADRFVLAKEAERLHLGEDEQSRNDYNEFAAFHLRQMTFDRYFKSRILEQGQSGPSILQPQSLEEGNASYLEGILNLGGYHLLVQPTERLRRRWLR